MWHVSEFEVIVNGLAQMLLSFVAQTVVSLKCHNGQAKPVIAIFSVERPSQSMHKSVFRRWVGRASVVMHPEDV